MVVEAASALDAKLRITEIFHSLQGESTRVGLPTVFVRLTGCPLRCVWCDTEYAFSGGENKTVAEILSCVATYGAKHVCVTGGEPLAQKPSLALLTALCDAGYSVSLETSGALDVADVDPRVSRIMDLKAPDSGEAEKNRWENIAELNARDEIKFVLASEGDYFWARGLLGERKLDTICTVLMSPVQETLSPRDLAEWILRDQLSVRMQVQMHKVIWGPERAR